MTTWCTKTLSRDHDWPGELDQDAQCIRCGLFYSEFVYQLGDLFAETRLPTAADERLRCEALANIQAALDVTPIEWPAHRLIRQIGQQVAGLRGTQLVEWADLVRAQQQVVS